MSSSQEQLTRQVSRINPRLHDRSVSVQRVFANSATAKNDLLAKLLRGELDEESLPVQSIPRRFSDQPPQLSLAQERLWFLDQLTPGAPVFNVPMAVRISRPIDIECLQRSLDDIVHRHEVFRTSFETLDGQPMPIIASEGNISLDVIDLVHLDESTRDVESQRLVKEEAMRPFDLSRAPLVRTSLIKLTERESLFLLTMHHIVSDGWSILIFFRELSALYRAYQKGGLSPLGDLPIQYSDFAIWQREWISGDLVERQLSYWKQKLGGELPVLEVPCDRQRPVMQTHNGARVALTLSEELTRELSALARREGATLFMTLLAAFKVLLHRYSSQTDIIVGTPMANRPRAETENLIGFFLNNLALRTDVSGDPTFRELLSRVRQTAIEGFANQDVPFEKVLETLRPERDLARTSIFQVYFNLFSFSEGIDVPEGGSVSFVDAWLDSEESLAKFDLTLYAGIGESEIKLALVYNTDLFSRERMVEMLAQLEQLLSQVIHRPDEKISRFSIVTPRSKDVLPNPTAPFDSQSDGLITQLFAEQAARRPNAIAVRDPVESWSYRELDRRSNQLANYLRAHGVNKGDVVAIFGYRNASLVWTIMGVLKSGAAFTILDPAYPASRQIDCLQTAAPSAFVEIAAAGRLPQSIGEFLSSINCPRLLVHTKTNLVAEDPLSGYSTDAPHVALDRDDLAYIAFTSGSTGKPKGVMGRHGPVTLFASWAEDKFALCETDRFCMLSGLAHDPLHRDIFTPLQLGGAICIPDPSHVEAPERLRGWMREQEITVANLTPAMSQLITESMATDEQINSLRYSFLVGDVLRRSDVARLRQLAPQITCVNLYGSTETQRAVSHYVVENPGADGERQILPLGKGIRDVQLLVLNANRQLCGVGEVGEIYFRSPHLAKGYFGDEKLTRDRFIPNPFTNRSDDRLYRTGDLGRYLPDGNVEHAGRADRQVKIRGYRIEPAEIEAALTEHPSISEAAVVACAEQARSSTNSRSSTSLFAYVVSRNGLANDADLLRKYLSQKLPSYMVPSQFVSIDHLPLTPNGKLDRGRLPNPALSSSAMHSHVGPRTDIERALSQIWKTVLARNDIGVHDNFFELGGHSLMAVRLFALIEKQFQRRLPLATLFQAPTIAELATIFEKDASAEFSSLVPIQPLGSRPPFFCVHAVGGNVLEYYDLARRLGTDQPFYGLQSRGLNSKQPPHARIEDMAAHYIGQLRGKQPAGPYFIGGRSLGGMIAYEMACQLRDSGQEVALLALLDSYPVGHHKLVHTNGASSSRLKRFLMRIAAHVSNVRSLPISEKVGYLRDKSQYVPIRIKSKLWRAIYRACTKLGCEMPSSLRSVEQFNWLAAHQFVPRLYDGRATLFWASSDLRAKFDLIQGWRQLVRGGLDIHEIRGTHLDMIKEPHVEKLGILLSECLKKAQAEGTD